MADMKENNMNDGVPSLDETAAEVDWQRCVGQVLRGRVPVR